MQRKIPHKPNKETRKFNFNLLCKRITLYVLLFIFKVLGLSPWKVNEFKILATENQAKLFEISKYEYLYNILLTITLSTYCIITVALRLWKQEYLNSDLVDKIDTCLMLYGTLVLVVVWLNYILQQKKIVKIVNGLFSINNNLKSCNRYIFKSNCHLYIICIINFFLCFGIFVSEWLVSGVYTGVLWFVPIVSSSWVLIQYTLLLNIIFQLFENINAKILELGNINSENCYQAIFRPKVLLQEFAIKDINCINYAVMQTCDICDHIADFYAIPTLLIIIYFITTTTFSSYFLILSLITLTDKDLLKLYLEFGTWFLTVSFDFVTFTLYVTRITREFSKTPQYISLLLNRCVMNSTTKETLLDFLSDLSYRHINFSTYGVITLDGTLLQTIYGTMVTYLIILIQFRNQ